MTELVWDGKYDKEGRRNAPLRVALPFQTVETVNESAQERQRSLDLFSKGHEPGWRNRLIWGDKKYVLPALAAELSGKVDLVYIDPPFATGDDFSYPARVPEDVDGEPGSAASFTKEPSVIEQKAYRDTWGVTAEERRGGVTSLDRYLKWFYETAFFLHELLAETGSLYVHLDTHVGHYAKAILDELFGVDQFKNEVVWKRTSAHSSAKRYGPLHDVLFFYTKSDRYTWNPVFVPHDSKYVESHYTQVDPDGRRWMPDNLTADGVRRGATGEPWRGFDVTAKGRHWFAPPADLDKLDAEGQIYWPTKGGWPRYKRYLDKAQGLALQDIWSDISPVNSQAKEAVGYPTQKPDSLLDRIVRVSSNEGDLVLDCFVGSGTTPVVAERLRRRWIGADLGRFAIHTARKRLLSIGSVKPFVLQNLGKYERQLWQAAEFGEKAAARTIAYRHFILRLYQGRPIEGYLWLHGLKQGRLVHVGTVDAPVTVGDVKQIAAEFRKAIGKGPDAPTAKSVDVLGWDFAFELNEVAKQEAARAGIDMRFIRIPREVLDKRAVEQGDVRFFELAALSVDCKTKGKTVTLGLTDFVIPLDDVPAEVQKAITSWMQWIDYWAVDWDNKGDTFHNEWQTYRTRESRELDRSVSHTYEKEGTYSIVVKVIDILGNDTTKTLKVEVK